MPPNCTSPEKVKANLIDCGKEQQVENLCFIPTNQKTEKGLAKVERLLNDLPALNYLFSIHSKIGEGTFSCVYLATLKNDPSQKKKFAIKHLIPTCHPDRIKFELECLKKLGGKDNIIGIELCLRSKNNIVFVMPYQPHRPFSEYVGKMDAKEASDYIKNLLIAATKLHEMGIIHRDIKPSNFLYDRKNRRYVLVDFGLAQLAPSTTNKCKEISKKRKREDMSPECSEKTTKSVKRPNLEIITQEKNLTVACHEIHNENSKLINIDSSNKLGKSQTKVKRGVLQDLTAVNVKKRLFVNTSPQDCKNAQGARLQLNKGNCSCYGKPRVCPSCLGKRGIHANRAGTPGFRPPEVLLKYPDQTTAVDIWAVGVIFMSILSNCNSFFTSINDNIALAEMVTLFGTEKISRLSQKLGRYFLCSEYKKPVNLKVLCNLLRKRNGNNSAVQENEKCSSCTELLLFCVCTDTSKDIEKLFPDSAFDLLQKLLDVDPTTRITAKEALKHEFLNI